MAWYELTKVLHFLGLFSFIGFFIVLTRVGIALRAARTTREVRTLATMLEGVRPMLPSGAAMLLVSGIIMTGMRWRAPYAFAIGGLTTLLVITPIAMIAFKRLIATIRAAVGEHDAGLNDAMRAAINTPSQWGTMFACNTAAVGVLLSMTIKPPWPWVTGFIVVLATIGWFAGSSVARKAAKPSAPSAPSRSA